MILMITLLLFAILLSEMATILTTSVLKSDTSLDALRDNSEPAALEYSEISDEDYDDGAIQIVISEYELTMTQPESIRRVTKYFA